MNSRLRFHLPLDDKAALRLCSRPRLCLFWTSPLSHVKQWFVHSNETPTVTITFPVCHTDSPPPTRPPVQYCLFWLYWDNGGLLCLESLAVGALRSHSPPPFSHSPTPPLPPFSCTLLRRRWWGHWHSSAHLIQLLQKQRECSSLDRDMKRPRGSGSREGGGEGRKTRLCHKVAGSVGINQNELAGHLFVLLN